MHANIESAHGRKRVASASVCEREDRKTEREAERGREGKRVRWGRRGEGREGREGGGKRASERQRAKMQDTHHRRLCLVPLV
jgi:hypothetical protein